MLTGRGGPPSPDATGRKALAEAGIGETPAQRARRLGVPLLPPRRKALPNRDPNPVRAVCGACGCEIRRVMMRACGREDCPVSSATRPTL